MTQPKAKPKIWSLTVSLTISTVILIAGIYITDDLSSQKVISRLLWPLLRLMLFICAGLVAGQIIEALGWTKGLAVLARPFFKFGNLGDRCSAAFTMAFFQALLQMQCFWTFIKKEKYVASSFFYPISSISSRLIFFTSQQQFLLFYHLQVWPELSISL